MRLLAGRVLLFLVAFAAVARAEDPPSTPPKEEAPPPRVPADDEAAALAEEVKTASKRKKAEDVLPVLRKLEGLAHRHFLKPLTKLLSHDASDVALEAARYLEAQRDVEPEAKARSKNARDVWKLGFDHPENDARPVVRGAAVRVIGAWGVLLDDAQLDDLLSLWRAQVGDPVAERAGALVGIVEYARRTKDKRLCRVLAEEIDQPAPTDVNAPNNPPQSWWEARFKLWQEVHPHTQAALKEITGQEFKSTEEAKRWFRANEKKFGFKW